MTTSKLPTVDAIYEVLENEIVELYLCPGTVLSENTLCRRFGVSRTPIRSVLQRLEQNRFVTILPHKGTIVTPIDLNIVNQLIYRRVALESMVLRDFIRGANPTQIEQVRYQLSLLAESSEGYEQSDSFDWAGWLQHDLTMHELWFKFTNNMFLWEELIKPQADYSRFIRLDIVGAKNVPDVLIEHKEMMRIIDENDIDAIEPLLSRHLYGGVRRLGSEIFSEKYQAFFKETV